MAGGFGYFWGGLAQGLQTGLSYKLQLQEANERKKLKEEENKLKEEISFTAKKLADEIAKYQEDKIISDEELVQWTGLWTSLSAELQAHFKALDDSVRNNNKKAFQEESEYLKTLKETIDGLTPEQAEEAWKNAEQYFVTPQGKQTLEVAKQSYEARYKAKQKTPEEQTWEQAKLLPADMRADYLRSQGIENIPEEKIKTNEASKAYATAEEAIKETADIPNFDKIPYQDSNGYWHVRYVRSRLGSNKGSNKLPSSSSNTASLGLSAQAKLNSMKGTTANKTNVPGVPIAGIDTTKYELMTDEELRKAIDDGDQGAIQYAISKGLLK